MGGIILGAWGRAHQRSTAHEAWRSSCLRMRQAAAGLPVVGPVKTEPAWSSLKEAAFRKIQLSYRSNPANPNQFGPKFSKSIWAAKLRSGHPPRQVMHTWRDTIFSGDRASVNSLTASFCRQMSHSIVGGPSGGGRVQFILADGEAEVDCNGDHDNFAKQLGAGRLRQTGHELSPGANLDQALLVGLLTPPTPGSIIAATLIQV